VATGTLTPSPYQTVLDANGNPVSGAKITTYVAGTVTPATTYTDVALTVANTNPIIADSAGRYVAYLSPGSSYKFVITTSAGVAVATQDNIATVPPTNINLDVTGTAGETISAGQAVYLSDGSGSKTAGSWYKADNTNAYSSTVPEVGMAPAAITSGATGTVRLAGQVTGLAALVVGTTYYVSTSGAITATPPVNRRVLGVADTTSSLVLATDPATPPVNVEMCQGRLTLTSGTAVTTADVTGAASVFFTPYKGNRIALYDGTAWAIRVFSEVTLALGTLTNDLPYDVFIYDNAGTITLESLAWSSKTARATALTTQDGVLVKTGATTRRYLGTFHTTATTTTEDSFAKRLLWNYYNRVKRPMLVNEATDTWTYSTATYRQANGSTANQLAFVVGVNEVQAEAAVLTYASNSTGNVTVRIAVGLDSTSAFAGRVPSGAVARVEFVQHGRDVGLSRVCRGRLSLPRVVGICLRDGHHDVVGDSGRRRSCRPGSADRLKGDDARPRGLSRSAAPGTGDSDCRRVGRGDE
jgi:hypothetical protein